MFSLLLEPLSLLILQNDMYTRYCIYYICFVYDYGITLGCICILYVYYDRYLHGISLRRQDTVSDRQRVVNGSRLGQPLSFGGELIRSTRVSLTIRHVPKTFKIKLKLK